MSATRLLFYTNKAATGWAALVRRNCAAPALPSCTSFPYCAALARRIGTAPALPSCSSFPYCANLARRNATAPALPSVSPSPYCVSFFIGLRHMSSNGRRAFLLDRIALGLEAEGIPYTEALDKTINKFFNETLEIKEFLNENLEDVDQGSEGEMQKMYSELDKIQSKLQSFQEHYFSLLNPENANFIRDMKKMCSELRYEIDKVIAIQRLDLNLEREGVHDELVKQYSKITDIITKLDQKIYQVCSWRGSGGSQAPASRQTRRVRGRAPAMVKLRRRGRQAPSK